MPFHIYYRVGQYKDAIEANQRGGGRAYIASPARGHLPAAHHPPTFTLDDFGADGGDGAARRRGGKARARSARRGAASPGYNPSWWHPSPMLSSARLTRRLPCPIRAMSFLRQGDVAQGARRGPCPRVIPQQHGEVAMRRLAQRRFRSAGGRWFPRRTRSNWRTWRGAHRPVRRRLPRVRAELEQAVVLETTRHSEPPYWYYRALVAGAVPYRR
jgi:hypothetical protein